jgi:hypothetical protein
MQGESLKNLGIRSAGCFIATDASWTTEEYSMPGENIGNVFDACKLPFVGQDGG